MLICQQVNAVADPIEQFKALTLEKLKGVRCPHHGKAPVVEFRGEELRDIRIFMRACCGHLSDLANLAIAKPAS